MNAEPKTYQSAADCPLGSAHGMASTHGNADDETCCDFCGFPVDNDDDCPIVADRLDEGRELAAMNADILNNLAARVEALEGADREVDAAIHYDILGWCRHANTVRSGAQSDTGFDCVDCGADSWGNKSKRGQGLRDALPRYTASYDAVMTLIEDGDEFELSTLYCIARAQVGVNRDHQTSWPGRGEHQGCDPVLALLSAALRARAHAAIAKENEGG